MTILSLDEENVENFDCKPSATSALRSRASIAERRRRHTAGTRIIRSDLVMSWNCESFEVSEWHVSDKVWIPDEHFSVNDDSAMKQESSVSERTRRGVNDLTLECLRE